MINIKESSDESEHCRILMQAFYFTFVVSDVAITDFFKGKSAGFICGFCLNMTGFTEFALGKFGPCKRQFIIGNNKYSELS